MAAPFRNFRLTACAAALLLGAIAHADAQTAASLYLGSKSTYAPGQDPASYEAPPTGFAPIYTEIVARHGSRGLSSASSDLALYSMWTAANAAGALTKLGKSLGPDLQRVTRANALLGYGVSGISAPGYGNLTQVGIAEHQGLAARMAARVSPLLGNAAAAAAQAQTAPRQIVVSTSGVNRAIDSSNFFTQSLAATVPGIAPLIVKSPALTAYPTNKPVAQAAGVNRFELYFHKLAAGTDLPATTDAYYPVYQSSRAYQSYLASDATMNGKVNGLVYGAASKAAARAALATIFTASFLDALDAGTTHYANTGSYTFTSDDGLFTTTVTGDGGTTLANLVDAANALYGVYAITPAMVKEVPVSFAKYLPTVPLQTLAYVSDLQDFYQKGPGIAEAGDINSRMSQALLDDFFKEVDAIAAGNLAHAAKLRFTHAEIIIPFATRLGLPWASTAVPQAQDYRYETNDWRGERVAPLAANVQWDVFTNGSGTLLVKMYYNEKETDFPPACEAARYLAGSASHYYEYTRLTSCYGHAAAAAVANVRASIKR
ncbi:histidine-type phosphatase [Paucibacter sp. R3-3]|uniref:Multiple inositol polyphosphate phosphatase 1 n=1 Tax=Roseateles agri TaxID=3098619 RepID=A0ABU5DFM3_9BURK|nr:histidine-type phosphatase [Paucibacter sp. R3-3]MDY0743952.1 histidine-type phosphatase [Paucibacter sp. R3-3]